MAHKLSDYSTGDLIVRADALSARETAAVEGTGTAPEILCGCEEDGTRGACDWDNLDTLEEEIYLRENPEERHDF